MAFADRHLICMGWNRHQSENGRTPSPQAVYPPVVGCYISSQVAAGLSFLASLQALAALAAASTAASATLALQFISCIDPQEHQAAPQPQKIPAYWPTK